MFKKLKKKKLKHTKNKYCQNWKQQKKNSVQRLLRFFLGGFVSFFSILSLLLFLFVLSPSTSAVNNNSSSFKILSSFLFSICKKVFVWFYVCVYDRFPYFQNKKIEKMFFFWVKCRRMIDKTIKFVFKTIYSFFKKSWLFM